MSEKGPFGLVGRLFSGTSFFWADNYKNFWNAIFGGLS